MEARQLLCPLSEVCFEMTKPKYHFFRSLYKIGSWELFPVANGRMGLPKRPVWTLQKVPHPDGFIVAAAYTIVITFHS